MTRNVQGGFTYVGILLTVAAAGVILALAGEVASTEAKRMREDDLLFAGTQIRTAIQRYADRGRRMQPGLSPYPASLVDLLEDRRGGSVERHLRRLYADPMTGTADWGLVRDPNGGIVGVYSRSTGRPLKVHGLPDGLESEQPIRSYSDWRFIATGPTPTLPGTASRGTSTQD